MKIKQAHNGRLGTMVDGGTGTLHEYEKRFRNILENSNDIILTVNNRGEIT